MLRVKMMGGQIKHVLCLQLCLGGLISEALKEPKAFVFKINYNNTLDIIWPFFKTGFKHIFHCIIKHQSNL